MRCEMRAAANQFPLPNEWKSEEQEADKTVMSCNSTQVN